MQCVLICNIFSHQKIHAPYNIYSIIICKGFVGTFLMLCFVLSKTSFCWLYIFMIVLKKLCSKMDSRFLANDSVGDLNFMKTSIIFMLSIHSKYSLHHSRTKPIYKYLCNIYYWIANNKNTFSVSSFQSYNKCN